MRKKRFLKQWSVFLTGAALLFGTAVTVNAENEPFYKVDINDNNLTLTYDGVNACGDDCKGHTITGSTKRNNITVLSGKHKIYLDGVSIDLSEIVQTEQACAFDIAKGAEVELTLNPDKENILKSGENNAGIHVPAGAKLTIDGENKGKLEASSTKNGAGIGTNSYATNSEDAGEITILGGTIKAEGGTAVTGGKSAPGIGGKNATIQLNGGNITATSQAAGTSGVEGKLSSEYGKEVVLTTTGNAEKLQNADGFNGVVWNQGQTICTVYGNAVLGSTFELGETKTMVLPKNTSLTLDNDQIQYPNILGKIWGDKNDENIAGGILIGGNNMKDAKVSEHITKKNPLKAEDIVPNDLTYSGVELKEMAIRIKAEDADTEIGWEKLIDGKPWKTGSIVDAGTYMVTYKHKVYTGETGIDKTVTVNPVPISNSNFVGSIRKISIPQQTYTGSEITPNISIKYGNVTLDPKKDFSVTYENNITPGTATAYINGRDGGNVAVDSSSKGEPITFKIVPASIEQDNVSLEKDSYNYDRSEHKPKVTVEVAGKKLTEGTDYTLEYPADCTNAGTKPVTVKGIGNYEKSVTVNYEIEKLSLEVSQATADPLKRPYDATDQISLGDVNVEGVLADDEADVRVDTKDLKGTVDSADIGTYKNVLLTEIPLTGNKAENYTVAIPEGKVQLKEPMEITQAEAPDRPTFKNIDQYEISSTDENTFVYTAELEDYPDWPYKPEELAYEYRMDDGAWQDDNVFDGIVPESSHTFEARTKETANIAAGNEGSTGEVFFEKLEQESPKSFTLKFTLNEDNITYTAVIPPIANGEYQFGSDRDFTTDNTKTDCVPNTEYTASVRYAETSVYKASAPVSDTQTTPMATVETPVINPQGGQFISSQEVTISCGTPDAVIYYTTDGKNPTTESTKYDGPFTIDATTSVKAIAVKDGMKDSTMAAAQFVKASGGSIQSKVDYVPFTQESPVSEALQNTEFSTAENIIVQLSRIITSLKGYTYENIAYYDITLEISLDGTTWEPATIDNFPKEGVLVTLPYPEGTGEKTHDFAVSHMFAETSERLGVTAGETEEPAVKKTADGLQFTLKSTSPVAVAWKEVAANDNNNNNNNNGNNNNGNNNNNGDNNGNDTNNNNNGSDNNGNNNNNGDNNGNTNNGSGTNNNGTNGSNGTNGTGTNGTTGAGGTNGTGVSGAISSILPKTGDPASFIPWIVLILLSAAAIITIIIKKRH